MTPDELHRALRPYAEKNDLRALWEIAFTVLLLVPLGVLLYHHRHDTLILALGSIPGALLFVRLFSLGHEAGHGALFSSPAANRWAGRFLACFSLLPYSCWHRMHHVHHQHVGAVSDDHEGYMWIMTRREYLSASRTRRALYRIYHHPLMLFLVGPILQFMFFYRWPGIGKTAADRRSVHAMNLVIVCASVLICATIGMGAFLHTLLPMGILAAGLGSWLFFVQHITDDTYWAAGASWEKKDALRRGSTFYDVPSLIRWCIANACYHPLHHLNPAIPCYRLRACWEMHAQAFADAPRVTLAQSLRFYDLVLWDEDAQRMVRLP